MACLTKAKANTESKIDKFCRARKKFRKLEAIYISRRFHEHDTGNLFAMLAKQRLYIRALIEDMVLAMAEEQPNFYDKEKLIIALSRPYLEPPLNYEN